MKLLLTIPLTAPDLSLASTLLSSMARLGPHPDHAVLFIASSSLTKPQFQPLLDAAKPIFGQGELIHPPLPLPDESYPIGLNWLFQTAAAHIATRHKQPWLWLDPRCVPLRRGWLSDIEEAYFATARTHPFMGHILTPSVNGTSTPLMAAPAVYPSPLPKRMVQRLVSQRGVAWEQSCADLVVPLAQPTTLIWTQGAVAEPRCAARDVPRGTVLAHTAAAASLTAELKGEVIAAVLKDKPPGTMATFVNPPPVKPAPPPPVSTFYHSGNLGDIIYSLAAIQLAGGGRLLLGPKQRRTPPCSSPIKESTFALLAPLLAAQPYISRATFTPRHPGTDSAFDLNRYRTHWTDTTLRARLNIKTIAAMHCHVLGVCEKFKAAPWLSAPAPIPVPYFTVHRSARYRSDSFPWAHVLERFKGRLLFVGLSSEHTEFQRQFRTRLPFWHCADFLDLARVISGSLGFIGNQSFPMSIALGLGQRVLQERFDPSPDCVLPRANLLAQPFTDEALHSWETAQQLTSAAQQSAHSTQQTPARAPHIVTAPRTRPADWKPSIYEQTPWPCGAFTLPGATPTHLPRGTCHFNPSIERVAGRDLLFARSLTYEWKHFPREGMIGSSSIALFDVTDRSKPAALPAPSLTSANPINQYEDPRTLQHAARLYLSCSTWRSVGSKPPPQYEGVMVKQSMFEAPLSALSRSTPAPFASVGFLALGSNGREWQKNWTWFIHEGAWHLIYTLSPLVIHRLNAKWQPTLSQERPPWHPRWPHSAPRGGSNPILAGSELISFFHAHSAWRGSKRRYYMGAVAMSAHPPFHVTRYTPEPLLTGSEEDPRGLSGPLVVFPGGAILHGTPPRWLVALGVNDESCAWIEIPHSELEQRMTPAP